MMAAGLRLLDVPFLDADIFKQVIMSCTRYLVINFVIFLGYGVTSTFNPLLDCPDGSLNVPDVLIFGACVQVGWC